MGRRCGEEGKWEGEVNGFALNRRWDYGGKGSFLALEAILSWHFCNV